MIYSVTKKYETGSEQPCRKFNTLEEARAFALESAETDARMKINTTYRLYEFDDVVATIESSKVDLTPASGESSSSSSGKGAGFRPTPLATSPRPKGTPPKWSSDDDDTKKE